MHQVASALRGDGVQQPLRGGQVVAGELVFDQSADLGMADNDGIGPAQRILPDAGLCHIGLDDLDVGVQVAKQIRVGAVFVDPDNGVLTALLQTRDQVLADQASSTGNGDLHEVIMAPARRSMAAASTGACRIGDAA